MSRLLSAAAACAFVAAAHAAPMEPATQAMSRQRVLDAAAATLFAVHGGAIEARPLDELQAELKVPAGTLKLHARSPEGAVLARRMVVNVDVEIDARHWRTLPVWFAVQAWRPVRVARVPLSPGQVAAEELFVTERRNVAALASPPLPPAQPMHGLKLRHAVPEGAVLTASMVEPRQAVARHQAVQVRVQAGPVELVTSGVALADARVGELVRVLNPVSRESYAARVVADGLVIAGER